MGGTQLMLAEEERQFLVTLLEQVMKEARIEEHRTRAPSYREHILQKEELVNGLLSKLGQSGK